MQSNLVSRIVAARFTFHIWVRWTTKSEHRFGVSDYAIDTLWKSPHSYWLQLMKKSWCVSIALLSNLFQTWNQDIVFFSNKYKRFWWCWYHAVYLNYWTMYRMGNACKCWDFDFICYFWLTVCCNNAKVVRFCWRTSKFPAIVHNRLDLLFIWITAFHKGNFRSRSWIILVTIMSWVGQWLCNDSVKSLGKPSQTWEIAYNHYANRRGLTNLTHTAALINVVRPTNVALFMVDESLSHAASF